MRGGADQSTEWYYLPPLLSEASVELHPGSSKTTDPITHLWPQLVVHQEPDIAPTQGAFLGSVDPFLSIFLHGL